MIRSALKIKRDSVVARTLPFQALELRRDLQLNCSMSNMINNQ